MNYFNLLPPETIEFIFKKLNSTDLINLRIVDKRFKQICEQIKIKQLCLTDKYYQSFWFYTNDPTYFNENSIEFSKFQNYATIFQFDKHLKRLDLNIYNFNFSILNQFKLLEQLEIRTNKLIDNYKLSLDHLKMVDFNLLKESYFVLTFDTIKLFAFRIENIYSTNDFVFNYSDKILFLELEYNINWSLYYDDYLKKFNNLQYLKINDLYRSLDRDILNRCKNLKILDLNAVNFKYYDDLREDIIFIIKEKENLKRSELEIYLNGVKLINRDKINQLKWSSTCNKKESKYNLLEFQIENYDLLKDNCDEDDINYCDLIKLIKIIPSSFTTKFPFITEVKANDHIDEDQFIKFLNNLTYLFELELINCGLTKSFYHKLIGSVYLNDLEHLIIEEKNDLEMNFDFILNLNELTNFQTNQIITNHIDLIDKLFRKYQDNLQIVFRFDFKNYIKVMNCNSEYYSNDYIKMIEKTFVINYLDDLDNVISELKDLKF